jgi:hypothetical protein
MVAKMDNNNEYLELLAVRLRVSVEFLAGIPAECFAEVVKDIRIRNAIKYYQEHPEAKPKRTRAKLNPEQRKAAQRAATKRWEARNPDRVRAQKAAEQRRRRARRKAEKAAALARLMPNRP